MMMTNKANNNINIDIHINKEDEARERAFRFLGYKARTKAEVARKLAEKGYDEATITRVIDMLAGYGYIDDEKYAMEYVKSRTESKRYGKLRIKQELRERGISDALIEQALAESTADEPAMALAHLEKKTHGNTDLDEKEKRRCFDYLMRRGFTYETARQAIRQYCFVNRRKV